MSNFEVFPPKCEVLMRIFARRSAFAGVRAMIDVFASEVAELMTKSPKLGLFITSAGFVILNRPQ